MTHCISHAALEHNRQTNELSYIKSRTGKHLSRVVRWQLPELEEVLEVVPEDWDCSNAGLVDTLLLVLVPSSAVFLKKLCCRA